MFIVWGKDAELGPTKIIKHHHSVKKFQTPSVSRRNARERNRVKQVNSGFCILKDHVPHLKNKTSKVHIIEYWKILLILNSSIMPCRYTQIFNINARSLYQTSFLQVDTLRAAVDYIKNLRELLGEPLGKISSV